MKKERSKVFHFRLDVQLVFVLSLRIPSIAQTLETVEQSWLQNLAKSLSYLMITNLTMTENWQESKLEVDSLKKAVCRES